MALSLFSLINREFMSLFLSSFFLFFFYFPFSRDVYAVYSSPILF